MEEALPFALRKAFGILLSVEFIDVGRARIALVLRKTFTGFGNESHLVRLFANDRIVIQSGRKDGCSLRAYLSCRRSRFRTSSCAE